MPHCDWTSRVTMGAGGSNRGGTHETAVEIQNRTGRPGCFVDQTWSFTDTAYLVLTRTQNDGKDIP